MEREKKSIREILETEYCQSEEFIEYLETHGPHFSKKLCEFAVSKMKNRDGSERHFKKEEVETLLKTNNIKLENDEGHDCVYVFNMLYADFFGSAMPNELYVAKGVKDYLDDPDGYRGVAFSRYMADLKRTKKHLEWEDMI